MSPVLVLEGLSALNASLLESFKALPALVHKVVRDIPKEYMTIVRAGDEAILTHILVDVLKFLLCGKFLQNNRATVV